MFSERTISTKKAISGHLESSFHKTTAISWTRRGGGNLAQSPKVMERKQRVLKKNKK